jgi:hypothetical protein
MPHALNHHDATTDSGPEPVPDAGDRAAVDRPEGLGSRSPDVRGRYPTWSDSEPRPSVLDVLLIPVPTRR